MATKRRQPTIATAIAALFICSIVFAALSDHRIMLNATGSDEFQVALVAWLYIAALILTWALPFCLSLFANPKCTGLLCGAFGCLAWAGSWFIFAAIDRRWITTNATGVLCHALQVILGAFAVEDSATSMLPKDMVFCFLPNDEPILFVSQELYGLVSYCVANTYYCQPAITVRGGGKGTRTTR